MSYLAEFQTSVGGEYATNALRFATSDEAIGYARDLFYRWTGAHDWRIAESTDAPNYTWSASQGAKRIEAVAP
jgi:hypothetical protein